MMAFKGHPEHARYMSCDVNIRTESDLDHDQHVLLKTGWGTTNKDLQ